MMCYKIKTYHFCSSLKTSPIMIYTLFLCKVLNFETIYLVVKATMHLVTFVNIPHLYLITFLCFDNALHISVNERICLT